MRSKPAKLRLLKPINNVGSIIGPIRLFLICSIFTTLLLSSSGVALSDSILLSFAIIAQWIPGALVWNALRQNRRVLFTESLGMGLVIGTLLALLSSQIFRHTPLGIFAWATPFLISVLFVLYSWSQLPNESEREISEPFSNQLIKSFLPALFFGVIQLSVWWRWHPLEWPGWWKYNVDVPYFESYSNSLALLGATQNLMGSISNSRYHWFAYAWVGSLTNSLQIDSFVVLTRLLPIVAMITGATIAHSWVLSKTNKYWAAGLASSVIVIGPGLSIGSFVMLRSPSSAISVGLSLAFVFLLFEIIEGSIRRRAGYVLLPILAVGIVGGKATSTVLAVGAVTALLLISSSQDSKTRKRIWLAGSLSLIALFLTYQLLISSPETRRLGFGIYLGWPGLCLTLLPMVLGLFSLLKVKHGDYLQYTTFCLSILAIGAFLSLVTYDSSGNQIYFFLSAATICVAPSIIGLNELLYPKGIKGKDTPILRIFANPKFLYTIFLSGLTSSFTWSIFENSTSTTGKIARAFLPGIIWLVGSVYALISARGPSSEPNLATRFFYFFIPTLLASSLVCSGSTILFSTIEGPIYSKNSNILSFGKSEMDDPGAISYNYVLAGEWVQKNTPTDSVFFSNRQCFNVITQIKQCDGLWTYASALSRRQFIIEGSAYFITSNSKSSAILRDQKLSIRFTAGLSETDWHELWERGVRWGWIDRKVSQRTEWGKSAEEVFSNEDVTIIRLLAPEYPVKK